MEKYLVIVIMAVIIAIATVIAAFTLSTRWEKEQKLYLEEMFKVIYTLKNQNDKKLLVGIFSFSRMELVTEHMLIYLREVLVSEEAKNIVTDYIKFRYGK